MKWANVLSLQKKNSLKPNTTSHNNTSWYTDTDGFLEHSPSMVSLYYRGPTLQKIILFWADPPLVGTSHKYLSFYDWLISLSIMSSKFIHVAEHVRISFLRLNDFTVCMYHVLFIHSFVDGLRLRFGCPE